MKTTGNKSLKASEEIVRHAIAVGIDGTVILRSRSAHRRHNPLGSTHAPQKAVMLNGIRMSIGQAKQYVAARDPSNVVLL